MLTATADQDIIQTALNAGAKKCIRKDLPLNEIVETIHSVFSTEAP